MVELRAVSTTIALLLSTHYFCTICAAPAPSSDIIDLSVYSRHLFDKPDKHTGDIVAHYKGDNPEELGSYVEGDILVPRPRGNRYNGLIAESSYWPNGTVPYEIKGSFNAIELTLIENAFKTYHNKSCIRFRPRTDEESYISIQNDQTGCWSSVGRIGGKQLLNLQTPVCLRARGTILHELLHVLGFMHEQSRTERDDYVQIVTENIKPNTLTNFDKHPATVINGFGVEYDYASVLHYSPKSFSRNGKPTIVALHKTEDALRMGQRKGFSLGDLQKLNTKYKCQM